MDTIIYAQSLENKSFGDAFYNGEYLFKEPTNLDLTDFFISIRILSDPDNEDFENVRYKFKGQYLYVYIPCVEKDTSNRYSPIILKTHYKDIDDVLKALDNFLINSKRHITTKVKQQIIQAIESFKEHKVNIAKIEKKILYTTVAITLFTIGYMMLKR